MNFELVRIALAVAGTSAAAYQDAKTSFIDDKLTIAMIVLGTMANIATMDFNFMLFSVGLTALIFGAGYLFYRSGQLGGGDVLLFCGIQALLPVYPFSAMSQVFQLFGVALPPLPAALSFSAVPMFLSVYLLSSFFAMAASGFVYAFKLYKKTGFQNLKPDLLLGGFSLALSFFLLYWSAFVFDLSWEKIAIVFFFMAPAVFLVAFKKDISQKVSLRWIPISKMEDEDVIDVEQLPRRIVEKYGIGRVLTDSQKKVLATVSKKEGIRKFPIQKDLPRFGPYILAALLVTLYFADPLSMFLFF